MSPFESSAIFLTAVALSAFVVSPLAAQSSLREPIQPATGTDVRSHRAGSIVGLLSREMAAMAEHVEGRISFLKAELNITEAQMPQWTAFADALRANAKRMSETRNTMMQGWMMRGSRPGEATISAPDRLDRMEKMMTAMTEAIRATKSALMPLYGVLSDTQKKVADQLIQGSMGTGRIELMHGPMGMRRM
jgi:LTXXQ motif family protein